LPFVGQEKTSTMMQRKQLEEIAATVKGVPVWGCLPGSTAAEAGVRYGDIVLAVNGVPSPSIVEYLEGRRLRTDGFELLLFRDGMEFTVFVPFRPPSDSMAALAEQIADGRYVSTEASSAPSKTLPS
jgi:S1-C subfamily serine protease